jgi:hypothetical protein
LPLTIPDRRVLRSDTGDLSDPAYAVQELDRRLPPTAWQTPFTAILDLRGKLLSPASLRRTIVTLGQRLRGGVYGDIKVVVVTTDPDIAELVDLIAREAGFSIFIADSPEIELARPAGDLTPAERETLNTLHQFGGRTTVSAFAGHIGIETTAANNRLVNLDRKGYLYRIKRGRRDGDLFVDPRTPPDVVFSDAPFAREALLSAGIRSNPYDTAPATLEGDAAERAAEILRRRGRAG